MCRIRILRQQNTQQIDRKRIKWRVERTLFLTREKTEDYLCVQKEYILLLNTSQISIAMVLFSI